MTQTDNETASSAEPATRQGIKLFRGADAPSLFESGTIRVPEFDEDDRAALANDGPRSPNLLNGNLDEVVYRGEGDDGMSLVRAWFGPHYVLPRHTHDGDCLYYVVAGSLKMGSQELQAGDGFFVPSDAPYAYEAGPDGVEVLEFRSCTSFGMKITGGQVERMRRGGQVAEEFGDDWAERRDSVARAPHADLPLELDQFRRELDVWLDEHADELAPSYAGVATLDDHMAQIAKVRRLTFDAGWARHGWPERVGGLGGSSLVRAYLSEALTTRDLVYSGVYSMPEVLGPSVITFAPPKLSAAMLPLLLRGDEVWCQGFSEPATGSNLGALTCRAVRTDDGWRVTGQKVWTSLAQYAQRCVLLTRSGTPESAHRGITALFVDMDTPGIAPRPIETMHGEPEFCEVFFDDVLVPFDRTLGGEGDGWAFAMDLLPYERSTSLWQRAAFLHGRLAAALAVADADLIDPVKLAEVTQLLYAFRARSRATVHRMAAGEPLGVETSIDKVLLASSEQAVFDFVADVLPEAVTIGDDIASARWRSEFLYSRAASIYGGSSEIQRNIIARRLLDLGNDR